MSTTEDAAEDPRKVRSRTRLLEAAATLLKSGGIEAVTVDAVTRASKVARTTLYRHFDNATQLRAAALERLLPPIVEAPPPEGPVRERLIELLARQATLIDDAPLHMTTLAWMSVSDSGANLNSLRHSIIEQYSRPFDALLEDPDARALLGDYDRTAALSQLIGPIAFTRLVGLGRTTRADCTRIVDDFLAARAAGRSPEVS